MLRDPKKPGRPRGSLARFKCHLCGDIELVTGGSSNHVCRHCKESGRAPVRARCFHQAALNGREAANLAVAKAIRDGEMLHPSNFHCADCGGVATEYDHRDYSRQLDVDPVCRKCNQARGPGLPVQGYFSAAIANGVSPYRTKKRAAQVLGRIGADVSVLDDLPGFLEVHHWQPLLPTIEALHSELKEPSHA